MTVQTSTNVASFNGNGVTQIFPIAFKFSNDTDLVVLLVDDATGAVSQLTLNSDYTVSGEGDEEGGLINVLVAPVAGTRLQVTRVVDILQLTDLRNQGKFFAEVHEDAFDLLTMIAQQQESAIKSALRVAESDPEPARMPTIAQRAGKVLSFDSAGNPVAVVPAADSSTALRLELAADSGAGIVGFDLETVYPAGSMGRSLQVVEIKAGELETKAGELETKAGELETKAGELEDDYANLAGRTSALESIGKPFTKEYVSPEQVITSGGALTVSHDLGVPPKLTSLRLVCKAAQHGYSVGDDIEISPGSFVGASSIGYGVSVKSTSTDIIIRYGNNSTVFLYPASGSGEVAALSNASWRLVVRAWA